MCKLTRGERFKDARNVHNQHGKQIMDAVVKATGVSKSTISDLENDDKERKVNYVDIVKLARHYGVSVDYLLGLTDVRDVNPDIRAVCEFTGLSEAAISQIRKLQSDSERDFSELLINPFFIALVNEIWEYSVAVKVDHCADRIRAGYKIPEAIASSLSNTEKHYLGMVLASNESQASYPLMEMLNAQNIGLLSDLADARAKRRLCQLLTEIEGTFVNRCVEEGRPDAVSLVHQMKEHSDGND